MLNKFLISHLMKYSFFGIVLNVTAGIGALAMGFLDDILGGKNTIQISNVGFIIACTLAVIAPDFNNGRFIFWIAGSMIGIFSGPNQAASRSLMGRMTPKNKENQFYGFFAFSGKSHFIYWSTFIFNNCFFN